MLTNVALSEILYEKLLNAGETALTATVFPASGSFINVGGYLRFGFKLYVGALDTAFIAQVKQDTSATQTASIKSITGAAVTVPATGDNNVYGIEVHRDMLDAANGFKYVTLDVPSVTGGNDYAAIVFWAVPQQAPATQEAATDLTILSPGQS